MQHILHTIHMQTVCKIKGRRSLIGNDTELAQLGACGCQFEPYITTGYSLCIFFW